MHSNDEHLRLAYGASLAWSARDTSRSHPEPEALLALAERSGSEATRLEVLDHVMTCDACRRDLDASWCARAKARRSLRRECRVRGRCFDRRPSD